MSMTMAARAHSGASLSAPVRRAQPARRKTSWLGRVARVAGKRPGRALILLTFGIVSVAIVANALMFQKARHPAPMLSASTPVSQSRTTTERRAEPAAAPAPSPAVEVPAQPIRPPARPTDLSQTQAAREAQPRPPAPVQAAPRAAAPAAAPRAAAAPARDPIADLINGGDLRPPADVKSANRSGTAPRT
ncbi:MULTISPECIES: hypothetical protein [Bosea]|uniref:hypothetical protein n=1 Tax=Bosea TaxID=85413 RepID=UPI00214F8D53|nr:MULTISPECIES: hypothetical protein [Bosea]MCR4521405.1 hypothetical protein [Bosea sp. 47.2.35]MDR6826830.1 hypothetical protein [Bosea robiniae]MDR6893540.1 hypothetical protein [Bosea sp. BE109]MDR7136761.1 hypothetical protein [Bosea sp. BE168]MDR7173460.1 hypothetical protein [Bosea sp. BE271]